MTPVIIAFGSNVGNSVETVREALQQIAARVTIEKVSSLYRTAPMYVADQPPFINGALCGRTELGPIRLLQFLKEIESRLGRRARVPNGPRELDLDIVAYGSLRLSSPGLTIPHPRLAERRFVLTPVSEIAADVQIPGFPPVLWMLAATEDQALSVQPISDAAVSIPSPG